MGERRTDKMHLLFFQYYAGHHPAAWRHPAAADADMHDFDYYRRLTQMAERAKLDGMFFGDSQGFRHHTGKDAHKRQQAPKLEPFTLLSALAAVTSRIGLAGTVSTSYNHPYTVARKLASLDHISKGRAGWNVVTSFQDQEARNFGRDSNFEHGERYARAHEFIDIAKRLWDSWDDDALVQDQASGVYYDPEKLHGLFHEGRFFKVEGPLNVMRSPQGYPVIIQAGSSGDGQVLAAATADLVFTSQNNIDGARAFYASLKAATKAAGRNPEHIKIAPSIQPWVASSEEELKRREKDMAELVHMDVALSQLQWFLGTDVIRLSDHDVDGPLPEIKETKGNRTFQARALEVARAGNLTIGQTALKIAQQQLSGRFRGTPEQVADTLELWFQTRACDAFCLSLGLLPTDLEIFCDQVVPILRKRGLFREEYEGDTFRDHLGLPRPANRYVDHPELHQEPNIWKPMPLEDEPS
jgi:FMN-dependent oxidoreductase (nitrilotriacetate monooxygenase family)